MNVVAALPRELIELADELSDKYVGGSLRIVAGAGVSRASGLPGWSDMAVSVEEEASQLSGVAPGSLRRILALLHGEDVIGRTDSIRRLIGNRDFARVLHKSLYSNDAPVPNESHWHLASMMDSKLMPDLYTANFDDLLEAAHRHVGTGGRIRHFHGKLPIAWAGTRLNSPPIVTTRDYIQAERKAQYDSLAADMADKTVLLVGLSLADPNLARVIRENGADCRALLTIGSGDLTREEQSIRLRLLRQFWRDQQVAVYAVTGYELLPGFLMELRRRIVAKRGKAWCGEAEKAWRARIIASPNTKRGLRELQERLQLLVKAVKASDPALRGDKDLAAGLYLVHRDGWLVHSARSNAKIDQFLEQPKRRLSGDPHEPWGVAGYAFAMGLPSAAMNSGAAFDQNVPVQQQLEWQRQRAGEERLPPASVLCSPVWCVYGSRYQPVGVIYLASSDGGAFAELTRDRLSIVNLLSAAAESMIKLTPSGAPLT